MAQANNPLSGLEFQIRNLISRGNEESLNAAEALIRAFANTGGSSGDLRSVTKDLTKTRAENQAKAKIREVRERGRQSVRPREQVQRAARQAPLQVIQQAGPPSPTGEAIPAGQPGGAPLITNVPGQIDIQQLPEEIETDLLAFTEDDIADLQAAGMPTAAIKQLVEARDETIARRQVREVSGEDTGIPENIAKIADPTAREAALKTFGREMAKKNVPLGTNAFKWVDPKSDTFETATPGMTEAEATKAGFKTVVSNNPQFITAARSGQQVLEELDAIVDELFTDKRGPMGSNFINIHKRRLQGDRIAQRFFGLIESTRALFARAGGDVANIAVAEQEFQAAALPSAFSSHRQAKDLIATKKRLLKNVVRSGLGLDPLPVPKEGQDTAARTRQQQEEVNLFGGRVVDSR